jgi:hypothetical protein
MFPPPTEKQVEVLKTYGVNTKDLNKSQAAYLIDQIYKMANIPWRERNARSSMAQQGYLAVHGINARTMTYAQAELMMRMIMAGHFGGSNVRKVQ